MSALAWVTLATNDSYCLGALVLAHSLKRVESVHPSVILITPGVTEVMRERLRQVFAEVIVVDVLDSEDAAHLTLLARPELGVTFTKLHCWTLTQYEKCVFLDADTLVLQNCDELFDREELSAAPDIGWPDCFNSGVFVYRPSQETFQALLQQARSSGSFDGGDQGLLNTFFSSWAHGDISKHLPFLYNIASTAFYSYLPALKQFGKDAKIMHFIGNAKPWLQNFDWERRNVCSEGHLQPALQLWWDIFCSNVHANLDVAMAPSEVWDFQIEEDVAEGRYSVPVDPESPFPWHKPSPPKTTQRQAVVLESLADFHDPWENYKGQIDARDKNIYNTERHNDNTNTQTYYRGRQESTHADTLESYQDFTHPHMTQDYTHPHMTQDYTPVNYQDKSTNYTNYYENKHTDDNFKDKRNEYLEIKQYSAPKQHSHSHSNISNEQTEHYHIPHSQHIDTSHIQAKYYPNINDESDIVVDYKEDDADSDSCTQHTDTASQYDEDTYTEEIKPRHPYDNFYMLHVPVFDKHGCKHCSCTYVEVPPTPPRSPSPIPQTPAKLQVHDQETDQQAGIAGTFSRITLGEEGQREAIDESQRRQGWEAGNADYMGADSFDNIWAKISQTLTGATVPPPSEPISTPVPPSEAIVAPEPVSAPEPISVPEPVSPPEPFTAPKQTPAAEPASVPEPVLAPELVPESTLAPELASATELLMAVESAATPVPAKEPSPPAEASGCVLPPRRAPADAPSCPLSETEDKPQPKSETKQPPDEQPPQDEETQEKKSAPKKKFVCHLKRPAPQPDALLTPDSELEDAASIAQSIIASETGPTTPLVISATPPIAAFDGAALQCEKDLCVDMSIQETPPVRSELVSLAQIGIVPAKSIEERQSISEETEQESVEKCLKAEEKIHASVAKIEHEPVVIPKKAEDPQPVSELTQPRKTNTGCEIITKTIAAKEPIIVPLIASEAEVPNKEKIGTQLQSETPAEAKTTAVRETVTVEEKTENAKSGSTGEKAKTLPKSENPAEKLSECKIEGKTAAAQEPVIIQKKTEDAKIEIPPKDIEIKTIAAKEPLPKIAEPAKEQTEIPPEVEQPVVETGVCLMKPKNQPDPDNAEEKPEDPKSKKASPKKSPKPAKVPEQSSAAKSAGAEAPVPPPRKKEKKPKK